MQEVQNADGAKACAKLIRQAATFIGHYTPEALNEGKDQYSKAMKNANVPHGQLRDQLWALHQQCWKALTEEAYTRRRLERLSAARERKKQRVANLSIIEKDRRANQQNRTILSLIAPRTVLVNAVNNGHDKKVQQNAIQTRQGVEKELQDINQAWLELSRQHQSALATIRGVLSDLQALGL